MSPIDGEKDLGGEPFTADSKPPQSQGIDTEKMEVGEVYCQPTAAEEKTLLRKIDWR